MGGIISAPVEHDNNVRHRCLDLVQGENFVILGNMVNCLIATDKFL